MAAARFGQLHPDVRAKVYALQHCSPDELDDRVLGLLVTLPSPVDQIDCLSKLDAALRTQRGDVRNVSAFLAGVIKRFAAGSGGPSGPPGGGPGGRSGPPPAPYGGHAPGAGAPAPELAPAAAHALEGMYAQGRLRRGDLDARSLASLAAMPAKAQAFIMGAFADKNLTGVRNMAAFFNSHLSTVERDIREGRVRLPPPGPQLGGPPQPRYGQGPGGLPPPPLQQQQQHQYDQLSGAYDPSEVQPPHMQQRPLYGAPPPQQQQQQHVSPQQGLPPQVDLSQLGSLLQTLAQQAPAPAAAPPAPAGGGPPKHFGLEQLEWGVRVDEFHGLSAFARYVHPASALKLQQLWDAGNKLVSLMDDSSWEALAGLDAQHSVAVVAEVAEAARAAPDDIATVNRLMLSAAARHPKRPNAPTAAAIGLVPEAAAPAAPAPMVHVQPALQQQQQPQQQAVYGAPPPLQQAAPPMGGMQGMMPQQPGYGAPPPQQQAGYNAPPPQQQAGYGAPPQQQQQAGYGAPPPLMMQPGGPGPAQPPLHMQPAPHQQPGMGDAGLPPHLRGPPLAGPPGQGVLAPPLVPLPGPPGDLPPAVQARLMHLIDSSSSAVRLEHFEHRVCDMLLKMGPELALRGLDDFSRNDPRSMRSVTAYLIGCLKPHQDEARRLGIGGGPAPAPAPAPVRDLGGPGPARPRDEHRYRAGGSRWEGPPAGRGGGRGPYDGERGGGRGPYGGGGMGSGPRRGSPSYD